MTNTDKTLSTERLEQIAASDTAHMGEAQRMASELLASRTQSPAEWQVEAAMNATPHEGSNVTVGEILAKAGAGTTTMRAALRAASITPPAPERSKEDVFEMVRAAFTRGTEWMTENPAQYSFIAKAAYDYADKATAALSVKPGEQG